MLIILLILIAYMFGSISSAIIVCKMLNLPDPSSSGSKNPGATNVLRIGGKKAATIALFGDIVKGIIPVVLARLLTGEPGIIAAVGIAALIGHMFPVFFQFKGGKGVATAFGVYLAVNSLLALLLVVTWLITAVVTRYSSLAALIAAALAPLYLLVLKPWVAWLLMSVVIAALLFWRHRENIARLRTGKESKINL